MASSPTPLWRWIGWAALGAFIASILWSMWADTLQPLVRAGDLRQASLTALGLGIILCGLALVLRGGWMAASGGLAFLASPEVGARVAVVRSGGEGRREAQRANLRALWRAMGPGLLLMALAFGCFGLGGWLTHL